MPADKTQVKISYQGKQYRMSNNLFTYILRAAEQDIASSVCDTYNDKKSLEHIAELLNLVDYWVKVV